MSEAQVHVFFVDDDPMRYMQLGDFVKVLNDAEEHSGGPRFIGQPLVNASNTFAGNVWSLDNYVDKIWSKHDPDKGWSPIENFANEIQELFCSPTWARDFVERVFRCENDTRALVILDVQLQKKGGEFGEGVMRLWKAVEQRKDSFSRLSVEQINAAKKLAELMYNAQSNDQSRELSLAIFALLITAKVPVILCTTQASLGKIGENIPPKLLREFLFLEHQPGGTTEEEVKEELEKHRTVVKNHGSRVWAWLYGAADSLWRLHKRPSTIDIQEWQSMRSSVRKQCALVAKEHKTRPAFAHHADGGGQPSADGRYDAALRDLSEVIGKNPQYGRLLANGNHISRWPDHDHVAVADSRSGTKPWDVPPLRALCQFMHGNDLQTVFRLLHEETVAQLKWHRPEVQCYLVDCLLTTKWCNISSCLWFNASALAQGLFLAADNFARALKDHIDAPSKGIIEWKIREDGKKDEKNGRQWVVEIREYVLENQRGAVMLKPIALPERQFGEDMTQNSDKMTVAYGYLRNAGIVHFAKPVDHDEKTVVQCILKARTVEWADQEILDAELEGHSD